MPGQGEMVAPELHHGLVVIAGGVEVVIDAAAWHERGGLLLDEGAVGGGAFFGATGEAEKNALNVAIDDGDALTEGDAGDGGAGGLADAGKGAELRLQCAGVNRGVPRR